MLIDRHASLTSIVAAVLGAVALVAFAQDCWVCTMSCTHGEYGPCSGPSMTVCENGAAAALPGETGVSKITTQYHYKRCWTYTGGTWYHSGDCTPSGGKERLYCSTGTAGQCCFWDSMPGGVKTTFTVPIMIQRCEINVPPCIGVADD